MMFNCAIFACLLAFAQASISVDLNCRPDNPTSGFYATIQIGNKNFNVRPDTGASDTVVVGQECKVFPYSNVCGPIGSWSSIVPTKENCGRDAGYTLKEKRNATEYTHMCRQDRAWSLYSFAKDTFKLGSAIVKDQVFGVSYQQSKVMFGGIDGGEHGILGLGVPGIHASRINFLKGEEATTFLETVIDATQMENKFSLCFPAYNSTMPGKFIIGADSIHNTNTIPYISNYGFHIGLPSGTMGYFSEVESLKSNGDDLGVNNGEALQFDSGEQLIILPENVFTKMTSTLCQKLGSMKVPTVCENPTGGNLDYITPYVIELRHPEQLHELPSLDFTFKNGVVYSVEPASYLYPLPGRPNVYALGVTGSGSEFTLGMSGMRGRWINFDREKNTIGWETTIGCEKKPVPCAANKM